MRTISDLPEDLVAEEILSRVPLSCSRSVRSTCKKWNASSKNRILGKKAKRQFMGFLMMDHKICFMNLDLQGIHKSLVNPSSIKQVSIFDQIDVATVFQCEGLLLCVLEDNSRLLVWNPYLGETKWIQPRDKSRGQDAYALGYDKKKRTHKILRNFDFPLSGREYVIVYEIYDFSSNSWKVLDVPTDDCHISSHINGASLKGNTYFLARKKGVTKILEDLLLCFDFTTESFRPLPLPFRDTFSDGGDFVSLSCVKEEQLAVLYQRYWNPPTAIEIFVTNKIDDLNAVSWIKFLKLVDSFYGLCLSGSFFIDQEKKVAVVFDLELPTNDNSRRRRRYQAAHIIGEDGYLKSVTIRGAPRTWSSDRIEHYTKQCCVPLVCPSYVPSLVRLQINKPSRANGEKVIIINPSF
ncbi:F-box-like domain superfamily [Arabidopsis thaliana x Arabidopsis arenosa]|uniref:F-box-like domain superfamily n=1 Tax=Arabidopsis thaliana x Arabidopsis arenosa TaxID=1240361 RepID=A0A8T2BDN8_9BRAS|nr:F-box-like domain superfamily [Arabidopsis thaliana x Arabidopsis arenosa]